MRQTILTIIVLLLTSASLNAQESPEALGKIVFACFSTRDYEKLSKLTPTANEILGHYRKIDSTAFGNEAEFKRKYISRDSAFVEKCIKIMIGNTGIDFKNAILVDIKYVEKAQGQTSDGEVLTRNYLEIHFISENKKYSLQFRDIRKIENVWKLGGSVRIKEEE